MKKQITGTFLFLGIFLVFAASGVAEIVTIEVTGVVNGVGGSGGVTSDGSVVIGTVMNGSYTFDTDAPDLGAGDGYGLYEIVSISMSVGNYTFTNDPAGIYAPPKIRLNSVGEKTYSVTSFSTSFDGIIYVDGLTKTYDDLSWERTDLCLASLVTSSPDFLPTDALPSSMPDISVFDIWKGFDVYFATEGGGHFGIHGELTSIPEPATILLLGLGGLALLRNRKSKTG